MAWIVHGTNAMATASIIVAMAGLLGVAVLHVWATRVSLRRPERVQQALGALIEPVQRAFSTT